MAVGVQNLQGRLRMAPRVAEEIPTLRQTWRLAGGHALQYQAALLFGSTYGQNSRMFSMRVQYGF